MAPLVVAPHYTYLLEDARLRRSSYGYFHPWLVRAYTVYNSPLKVGDIITDFSILPKGPYKVTEIGTNQDGKYARVKEVPYIEYLKQQGELHHISEAQLPFHDDIIMVNYNIKRAANEFFSKTWF